MKEESVELASDALRRLRDSMSGMEAPPAARSAALAAYRARQSSRRWNAMVWAGAGVAACAVLALLTIRWITRAPETAAVVAVAPPPVPVLKPIETPVEPQARAANRRPSRARALAAKSKRAAPPQPAQEVATDFLPIPFAPPLDPAEGGQVIRVRLPRSAMSTVGLPVDNGWRDRVPADVVVGGDGIARAVRFVGFTK